MPADGIAGTAAATLESIRARLAAPKKKCIAFLTIDSSDGHHNITTRGAPQGRSAQRAAMNVKLPAYC